MRRRWSTRVAGRRAAKRLHRLLEEPNSSAAANGVFLLMIVTILASVLIFYLRSVPRLNQPGSAAEQVLRNGELVCVGVFTCELILRCIAATLDPR